MSAPPKYRIEADTITGLIARLVYLVRVENPSLGEMRATCLDGSRVSLKFNAKKEPEARCRQGIEIDGARLG